MAAFPGANGKIAFETTRDGGDVDIFSMEADGTGSTNLTSGFTGDDLQAALSPDGTQVVFSADRDGDRELYLMDADDGGNVVQLTSNSVDDLDPTFSPTGTSVAWTRVNGSNWEIMTKGTTLAAPEANVTNDPALDGMAAWSPDGATIAFRSDRHGNPEIYTIPATGGTATRLTNNSGLDLAPEWSPDGTTIVFETNRDGNGEIYSVPAAGGTVTRITNNALEDAAPDYSPDGAQLAWIRVDGDVEVMVADADGTNAVNVTNNATNEWFSDWAPATGASDPVVLPGSMGSALSAWGTGTLGNPNGIAFDSAGNAYVAESGSHRISKFNSSGSLVTTWGSLGSGSNQLDFPIGVAVDGSDNVYVADAHNHRIQKFDSSGTYLATIGSAGSGAGQLASPENVDVDSAGNVYVADAGNDRIVKFDALGGHVFTFGADVGGAGVNTCTVTCAAGTASPAAGALDNASGITVAPSGDIYVADRGNNRVQKFDSTGAYTAQWGGFSSPFAITSDAAGNLYVTDQGNKKVKKFDSSGSAITEWSVSATISAGLDIAANGDVYVSSFSGGEIERFQPTSLPYTEDTPATAIDSLIDVVDADSSTLKTATVAISGFASGDTVSFADTAKLRGSLSGGGATLTIKAKTAQVPTVADFEGALRSVKFSNTNGSANSTRTATFTVSDGSSSDSVARTIAVTAVDDTPSLAPATGSHTYTEDNPSENHALTLGATFDITDEDSTNMASGSVTVSGWQSGEDALTYSDPSNLVQSYDATTGAIALSGSASVATYESFLQSVKYQNTSDNPSTGNRTVSFTVNDGTSNSNTATRTVSITATNDAPSLTPATGTATYTEDDPTEDHADAVAADLDVNDPDTTNIASGSVSASGWKPAEDVLSYSDPSNIVASYNATTGAITLSTSASQATYEAFFQSIKFKNTSETPTAGDRTFSFQVNDGTSNSNSATRTVSVAASNDPPDAVDDARSWNEDSAVTFAGVLGNDTDPENNSLTVNQITGTTTETVGAGTTTVTTSRGALVQINSSGGLNYDPNGQFEYLDAGESEDDTFTYRITDGNLTDTATVTVTVTGVNDAPSAVNDARSVGEDAGATALPPAVIGNDTDPDDSLTVDRVTGGGAPESIVSGGSGTVTTGKDAIVVMNSDGTFTYNPNGKFEALDGGETASDSFTYRATDGDATGSATVDITINGANDAPTLSTTTANVLPYVAAGGTTSTGVVADPNVSVADVDSEIDSATVMITGTQVDGEDVLSYVDTAAITGSFDSASGTLTLSTPTTATPAEMQAALRSVQYRNTVADASRTGGLRTIRFKVTDAGTPALASSEKTRAIDAQSPKFPTFTGTTGDIKVTSAAFSWTTTDDVTASPTVTCSLSGPTPTALGACGGGTKSFTGLDDGAYTFTLKSTDDAGNTFTDTKSFFVDTVAPNVTLNGASGPLCAGAPLGATCVGVNDQTFTWSISDPAPSSGGFAQTCDMDGTAVSCTSPKTYPDLAEGDHTFTLTVKDDALNEKVTTKKFFVDTVNPTVSIDSKPDAITNDDTPTFTFTGVGDAPPPSSGGPTLTCRIDSGAFSSCASGDSFGPLANGTHTFTVRATDGVGRTKSDSYTWQIDAVPAGTPSISLTKKPAAETNSTTAEFQFNFSDPSPSAGVTVTCKLDGGAGDPCGSGAAGGAVNDSGSKTYTSLSTGAHTFVVTVKDNATNETSTATHNWFIDTTAPTVALLENPPALTNQSTTTPPFKYQASDAGDSAGGFKYQCSLDGGQYFGCGAHPTAPVTQSYSGLSEGSHDFAVTTTDDAGNTSVPATYEWDIDTTPPVISIPFPRDGARFSKFSTKPHIVAFSCSDPTSNGVSSGPPTCVGDLADGSALPHGTTGSFDFEVNATDQAGNPAQLVHDYKVMTFEELIADDNPEAYWRLSEPAGSESFEDNTGDNDGTFKNSTQSDPAGVSADGDSSREFHGPNAYGFVNGISVPQDELTLAAFVKLKDRDGNGVADDGTIMQHGHAAALWVKAGKAYFLVGNNDDSAAVVSTTTLAVGVFHHLVGTWDGGDARLYVNGALEATKRQARAPGSGSPTLYIDYGDHAPWLRAIIDEVAYFRHALTTDEVADHYLADPPPEGDGKPDKEPQADNEPKADTPQLAGRWTRPDGSVIKIVKRKGRYVGKVVQVAPRARKARRGKARKCGLSKGLTALSVSGKGATSKGTVVDAVKNGSKCTTRKASVTAKLSGDELALVKKVGKRRIKETWTR